MAVEKSKAKSREKVLSPRPFDKKAQKVLASNNAPSQTRRADVVSGDHFDRSPGQEELLGDFPPLPSPPRLAPLASPTSRESLGKKWLELKVNIASYADSDEFHAEIINPRHEHGALSVAEVYFRDGGYEVVEAENSPIGLKGYPSRDQFDKAVSVAKESLRPHVPKEYRS